MGVWQIAASGKRRATTRPSTLLCRDAPPEGRPGVPGIWVAHGRGLVDLRKQLGLDADRRSFGTRGPGGVGPLGPSGTGEVPLRSEALAQGVLEVS